MARVTRLRVTSPRSPRLSELTTVGAYRRPLGASLERLLENALDWEHLPYLHATTFSDISCVDAGRWGWRAEVTFSGTGEVTELELLLEPEARRWVSRTSDGSGAGAEIWSVATATGSRTCTVEVAFRVPGVRLETAARLGAAYVALYTRLYDEDESMMVGRQDALDRRGDRVFMATRCPHRLGPLDDAEVCDGVVTCPWHGYRFDVATGACLDDPRLHLRTSLGEKR